MFTILGILALLVPYIFVGAIIMDIFKDIGSIACDSESKFIAALITWPILLVIYTIKRLIIASKNVPKRIYDVFKAIFTNIIDVIKL